MGTSNFWNHENGLFVVEGYTFEDAKEYLYEGGEFESHEEITDEQVYAEQNFLNEHYFEDYMFNLQSEIALEFGDTYATILDDREILSVYNKAGKWVADLELRGGYYSDAQIIVHTDGYTKFDGYYDTKTDLLEQWTPNHKRLIKFIKNFTTPLEVVAQFSNGETFYGLVS